MTDNRKKRKSPQIVESYSWIIVLINGYDVCVFLIILLLIVYINTLSFFNLMIILVDHFIYIFHKKTAFFIRNYKIKIMYIHFIVPF